jgi:ankyrin repeat protein
MERRTLSCCTLIVGCLLVSGSEPRVHQEPPQSTQGVPGVQPAVIGNLTPNDGGHKAADPIAKSETLVANQEPNRTGADVAAKSDAQDGLVVRIELDGADDPRTLNYEESFRVVQVNNSDQTIRIWNPGTENGYYQFSFRIRNLRSGETYVARKRRIDDKKYWKLLEDKIEPESETIEIGPKNSLTTQVKLGDGAWGDDMWEGLPCPNSSDRFEVSARFESTILAGASRPRVWTGKIQSIPIIARLIAPRLKTPHDYLWNGFPAAAIEMMKADPKWISAKDGDSCTPLHHAARFGHTDAVKWLLDHGADVNAIAYNGFTPLLLAEDVEVIELILQKHPDLSIRDSGQDETALQSAAAKLVDPRRLDEREKWRRIVKMYMDNGAEYDILTAIHLDDLERVKEILRKSPAYANGFRRQSPLRTAAELGRLEICRYLIDQHHVDVDDFDQGAGYPIIRGALAHPRVVELLIKSGADLKTRITWRGGRTGFWIIGEDATALHHAAADGVPETIKLLIDHGVDIFATTRDISGRATQQTALEVAAAFGKGDNAIAIASHPNFDRADRQLRQGMLDRSLRIGARTSRTAEDEQRPRLIKVLLDKGANPNATHEGITAMQGAARRIHPNNEKENSEIKQVVALLRERGAIVDLFSAVAIGDEEEVRRLLKNDPKAVNFRGPDGDPALSFAVAMNDKNIVAALLKAGGEVDIRNKSEHTGSVGETALHAAAFWGRPEIARLLIDAGADVNALTDRKSTPLHEAARLTNVKMVRLLLEKGAKPDARDQDNKTPLDCCHESKSTNAAEIEKVFREHHAQKNK